MLSPARPPTEPAARHPVPSGRVPAPAAARSRRRFPPQGVAPAALGLVLLAAAVLIAGAPAPLAAELADAQRIMRETTPAELDAALAAGSPEASAAWGTLLEELSATTSRHDRDALAAYLVEATRAAGRRLGDPTCRTTSDEQVVELARRLVVDRDRFARDQAHRAALEPVLHAAMGAGSPSCLRARVLGQLDEALRPSFDWLEHVAVEWGVARRSSEDRRLATMGRSSLSSQGVGPVRLSLYSLPDALIAPEEALRFLEAVRAARPDRTLVVVASGENLRALAAPAEKLDLVLVDSFARGYSPWPRDALTFLRDPSGSTVLLLRPNQQPTRERDSELGRLLVASLPDEVDRALGELRWALSPIPFHNGQILETGRATWVSIHTLERRALELLGRDAVPVDGFGDPEVLDEYLGAVGRAAAELEELLGRPVGFVHPLPAVGSAFERQRAALLLGGGAGYDLDSLLTLLPRRGLPGVALVASLVEGSRLLAEADDPALAGLASTYRLAPGDVRQRIEQSHRDAPASSLQAFLDRSARHLAEVGLEVVRLPLLLVPADARTDGEPADFLIGWNNVVSEAGPDRLRAEGFASGLAAGDRRAREAFAAAGYDLDLFPPLIGSVLANGGYRCASNHDRAP
jgi:hypothetical protein